MENENKKWVYDNLSQKGVDLGSYEQFESAISDKNNRRWVYDQAKRKGLNLGNYEDYERNIIDVIAANTSDDFNPLDPFNEGTADNVRSAKQMPTAFQQYDNHVERDPSMKAVDVARFEPSNNQQEKQPDTNNKEGKQESSMSYQPVEPFAITDLVKQKELDESLPSPIEQEGVRHSRAIQEYNNDIEQSWGELKGMIDESIKESVSKGIKAERDFKSAMAGAPSTAQAGIGLLAQSRYNKEVSYDRILQKVNEALSEEGSETIEGTGTGTSKKEILYKKAYNYLVEKEVPSSSIEYILKNAFNGSIVGMMSQSGLGSMDAEINAQANEEYDANWLEKGVAGAGSLVLDAPAFALTGGMGAGAAKATLNTAINHQAKAMIAKGVSETVAKDAAKRLIYTNLPQQVALRIGAGAISGGVNFAGYDAIKETINQVVSGELDAEKVLSSAASGMAKGAAFGVFGSTAGHLTRNLSGVEKMAANLGTFVGEASMFTGIGVAEQMFHGAEWEDIDLGSDMLVNSAMIAALKASHPTKLLSSAGKLDANGKMFNNLKFTQEQVNELKKAGYNNAENTYKFVVDLLEKSDAHSKMATLQGETGDMFLRDYTNIMNNTNISLGLKAKLLYLVEGKVTNPSLMTNFNITNNDDNTVSLNTFDGLGRVIERQTFESIDKAKEYAKKNEYSYKGDLNKMMVAETMNDRLVDDMYNSQIIQTFIRETGIPVEDIVDIFSKKAKGEQLTAGEKGILDNIRAAKENVPEYVKAMSSGVAESIKEEFGINPNEAALKKTRTVEEQKAIDTYVQRLLENVPVNKEDVGAWWNVATPEMISQFSYEHKQNGKLASLPAEKHNIKVAVDEARNKLLTEVGESKMQMIEGFLESLDINVAISHMRWEGFSNAQIGLALDYYNSSQSLEGAKEKIEESVDARIQEMNKVSDSNMNTVQRRITEVSALTNNGKKDGYLVNCYFEIVDGEIKTNERAIYFKDKETGKIYQLSPDSLEGIISDKSIEEVYAENEAYVRGTEGIALENELNYSPNIPEPQLGGSLNVEGVELVIVDVNENGIIALDKEIYDEVSNDEKKLINTSLKEGINMSIDDYKEAMTAMIDNQPKPEGPSQGGAEIELPQTSVGPIEAPKTTGVTPTEPIQDNEAIKTNAEDPVIEYHKMSIEETMADLNDGTLTSDEIDGMIKANIEEHTKAHSKLVKKAPKIGSNKAKYLQDKLIWEESVKQEKEIREYWEKVKDAVEARRLKDSIEKAKKLAERPDAIVEKEDEVIPSVNMVGDNIKQRWNEAKKVEGSADNIIVQGESLEGKYVIVEAESVTPSHNSLDGFKKSLGYPENENGSTVNDRDYERDNAAQDHTRKIAESYDQRAVQAPIFVSKDGVVLSGNGRTMAGQLAAMNGTDVKYNDYLKDHAGKYGFTAEQVSEFKHPRIVFVLNKDIPYETSTYRMFNQSAEKAQSKTETSVLLGKTIDDKLFGRLSRTIDEFESITDLYNSPNATRSIIKELTQAGIITEAQIPEMMDGDIFSLQGRDFLENALVGKVLSENDDTIRMLATYKGMRQSIVKSLSSIISNFNLGEYSLSSDLTKAIQLVYEARKAGYKEGDRVSDFTRQVSMFEENALSYDDKVMLMIADNLNKGGVSLKKLLNLYNERATLSASGQADIFTGSVDTKEGILNNVLNNLGYGQGTIESARTIEPAKPSGPIETAEHVKPIEPSEQAKGTMVSGGDAADGRGEPTRELPTIEQGQDIIDYANDIATAKGIENAEKDVDLNPTDAQKEAGNYKKGHIVVDGHDITIENPKGSVRSGIDATGKEWSVVMNNTYGYIRRTEGADGDHVDVFLSDQPHKGNVYIIDQVNSDGTFDEHKVMYGFPNIEGATEQYHDNYSAGWKGLGAIKEISRGDFKEWLKGNTKKPYSMDVEVAPYEAPKQNEGEDVLDYAVRIAEDKTTHDLANDRPSFVGEPYEKTHEKNGKQIHIVPLIDRVSDDIFNDMRRLAKAEGGMYSNFISGKKSRTKVGFVFNDKNSLNNFIEKVTNEYGKIEADTEAIASKAEAIAKQTEPTETAITEQESKERITKIDDVVQEINDQLALLGYYDVTGAKEKDYNEATGYMKAAERKFSKDLTKLSKAIAQRLTLEHHRGKKGDVFATTNLAPIGGDGIIRLTIPGTSKQLYINVMVDADTEGNLSMDDKPIMYRVEDGRSYGMNNYADANVTLEGFIKDIMRLREINQYLRGESNQSVSNNQIVSDKPISELIKPEEKVSPFEDNKIEEVSSELEVVAPKQVLEANGYKVDDKIIYKGKEATIYQFDNDGRPILDTGMAPIVYEVANWEDVRKLDLSSDDKQLDVLKEQTESDLVNNNIDNLNHGRSNEPTAGSTGPTLRNGINEVATNGDGLVSTGDRSIDSSGDSSRGERPKPRIKNEHEKQNPLNTRNFLLPEDYTEEKQTSASRLKGNVEALRVLKSVILEGKQLTDEDRQILGRFTGWGGIDAASAYGLYNVKDNEKTAYEELISIVKEMDPKGDLRILESIRKAALTSYYTPIPIVRGIHNFLSLCGYDGGGSILDPSMGTGIYESAMSKSMQQSSMITGVELDWLTGNIVRNLFPDANIKLSGYEKAGTTPNSFDVVMSNIPFGDIKVFDPTWKNPTPTQKLAMNRIHSYFTVKMIEDTKPGGLISIISSSALMDARGNQSVRDYISNNCEFIGAVRLPSSTFKNTGTEVVTDAIFLRKLKEGEKPMSSSLGTSIMDLQESEQYISDYFQENPQNVIGEMTAGGMYGKDSGYRLYYDGDVANIAEKMNECIKTMVESSKVRNQGTIYDTSASETSISNHTIEAYKGDGSFVRDGNIITQDGNVCVKTSEGVRVIGNNKAMLAEAEGVQNIRTSLKKLLAAQIEESTDTETLRNELNKAYEKYIKKHGRLNESKLLANDVDRYVLRSLEVWKNGKYQGLSDIFSKNTFKPQVLNIKTPQDAIRSSLGRFGRIDNSYMEQAFGETWSAKCDVFKVPFTNGFETREQYLSGDVKSKLEEAQKAVVGNPEYEKNVEALKDVIPVDVEFSDINCKMGARWLPNDIYNKFLKDNGDNISAISYNEAADRFNLDVYNGTGIATKFSTQEKKFSDIFEAALYDKDIVITIKDSKGNVIGIDKEATDKAKEAVSELKEAFADWIGQDAARAELIQKLYNDKFNRTVRIESSGKNLQPVGLSNWELRPHQKDAVWMLLQNNGGIIDHIVGAGKTLVMQAAVMEMRRMGIAKKPMIIALKATVQQMAESFSQAYPGANILVPTDKDFSKENRKEFVSRIALSDFDGVILSHEQFGMLAHNDESWDVVFSEQKALLMASIAELAGETSAMNKRQRKMLEKKLAALEVKQDKMKTMKKDNEFIFEELGIDHLFVDESHKFKNLFYSSNYNRIKGMGDRDGSQAANNLLAAIRYLQRIHQGDKGVTFLSGTTLTNSFVEIYNILNYLRPNKMASLGMRTFDAFASTFATHESGFEFGVTNRLKEEDRFRNFTNLAELSKLYTDIADVRDDSNLKLDKPKGVQTIITVPKTPELETIMEEVVKMVDSKDGSYFGKKWDKDSKPPVGLWATDIATKAAISPQLVDASLPRSLDGKIAKVASKVKELYDKFNDDKGLQLIFLDTGVSDKNGYSAYDDIINTLVTDFEIPRNQIADIHEGSNDKKREELFRKAIDGDVRIILGGTKNLGTGVNVQKRLTAIHHIDVPWTPSDFDQRNGRGVRQGNEFAKLYNDNKVDIFFYATEGSLDTYKYQLLDVKSKMFAQFKRGSLESRDFKDESDGDEGLDPSQVVAILSGNPIIFEKSKIDKKVDQLKRKRRSWDAAYLREKAALSKAKADNKTYNEMFEASKKDIAVIRDNGFVEGKDGVLPLDVTVTGLNGKKATFKKAKEMGEFLRANLSPSKSIELSGFGITAKTGYQQGGSVFGGEYILTANAPSGILYKEVISQDPVYAGQVYRKLLQRIISNNEVYKNYADKTQQYIETAKIREKDFPNEKELSEAIEKQKEITAEYDSFTASHGESKPETEDGNRYRTGMEEGSTFDRDEVNSLAKSLNSPVHIIEDVSELPANSSARRRIEAGKNVKGWYDVKTGTVQIYGPNTTNTSDAKRTVLHEIVGHKGLRELFGEDFDDVMDAMYENLPFELRHRVALDMMQGRGMSESIEEILSEIAEEDQTPSWWRRLISRLREIFRKRFKVEFSYDDLNYILWRSKRNLKESDPLDVAKDISMRKKHGIGEYKKETVVEEMSRIRSEAIKDGSFMKAPNGKKSNLTERQWLETRTKSFKKWFAGSKVVDENGEPLVVYHGTTKEFSKFDTSNAPSWFSSNRDHAKQYTMRKEGNISKVSPCYLNIRNVADVGTLDGNIIFKDKEDAINHFIKLGLNIDEELLKKHIDAIYKDYLKEPYNYTNKRGFSEILNKGGYDGMIAKEVKSQINGGTNQTIVETYAVLNANQIKSARTNDGGFDPGNDDIRSREEDNNLGRDFAGYSYDGKSLEEKSNIQIEKAESILSELKKAGFKDFKISSSITRFGASTYIHGDLGIKFRLSDHDITNFDRINSEIPISLSTSIESILKMANDKKKQVESIKDKRRLEKERYDKLDEKWEYVKDKYKGLVFKKNDRTYQKYDEFSKGGKLERTNILQTHIDTDRRGVKAFSYEWSEPDGGNGIGSKKPSYEYIESIDKGTLDVGSIRFREEDRPERQDGESFKDYMKRLNEWKKNNTGNIPVGGEEHYIKTMAQMMGVSEDEIRNDLENIKNNERNKEAERIRVEKIIDKAKMKNPENPEEVLVDKAAVKGLNRDEQLAYQKIANDISMDTSIDGLKRAWRDETINRRRYIESNNLQTIFMIDDIKDQTTKEQRELIPHIMEGTYTGEISDELKEQVAKITSWFDKVYDELLDNGVAYGSSKLDNYVTHIWDAKKSNPEVLQSYNAMLKLRSPYTKKRVIATIAEGIEMGLVPKYTDVADIIQDYAQVAYLTIANKKLLDFMKGVNVNTQVPMDNSMPLLVPSSTVDGDYILVDNDTLSGYKVHRSLAHSVNTIFGSEAKWRRTSKEDLSWDDKLWKLYDIAGSTAKRVTLSLSFFHAGALTESAIAAMNPIHFSKVLAKNMIWDALVHKKLPTMIDRETAKDAVDHMVQLGASSDYDAKDVGTFTGKIAKWADDYKKAHPGLPSSTIKVLTDIVDGINTGMDKFLWSYLHDSLKMYTYKKYASEWRAEANKKGYSERTVEMGLNNIGQMINDQFGGQHWELVQVVPGSIGVTPQQLLSLKRTLLSPDWNISTIRQFMALTGNMGYYDKNDFEDGTNPTKGFQRRKATMYWLTAMLFFGGVMNGLNAIRRDNDKEKEDRLAKEIRKNDQSYKSPYEIKYPDGMKWYDYTMFGNTIGKTSDLFIGRNEDGTELYARWGKQFREVIELIYGHNGFDMPQNIIDKMQGKANPVFNMLAIMANGKTLSGYAPEELRDEEKKNPFRKWAGRISYTMVNSFIPWSVSDMIIPDAGKDWNPISLVMPTSKGFGNYKAKRMMEDGLVTRNMDMIETAYDAAVMNKLDADNLLKSAISSVEATQKKEYQDGILSLNDAVSAFDNENDATKKATYRTKLRKMLLEAEYNKYNKSEAIDKVSVYLFGEAPEGKASERYNEIETSDDVIQDYQMSKIMNAYKPIIDKVNEMIKSEDKGLQLYIETHKDDIEKYKEGEAMKRAINGMKRGLGRESDDDIMKKIREVRAKYINDNDRK